MLQERGQNIGKGRNMGDEWVWCKEDKVLTTCNPQFFKIEGIPVLLQQGHYFTVIISGLRCFEKKQHFNNSDPVADLSPPKAPRSSPTPSQLGQTHINPYYRVKIPNNEEMFAYLFTCIKLWQFIHFDNRKYWQMYLTTLEVDREQ